MKNKSLLLLILGVAFFAGCNNDDDDDNALVGTWNLTALQEFDTQTPPYVSGPFALNWEAEEGTKLMGFGTEYMVAVVDQVANKALVKVLKDITFQKNGQVVATYSDAGIGGEETDTPVTPNWKVSEAKYLKYKVVSDNQLQLYLNVENILKEADINIDNMTSMSTQLETEDLQKLMSFVTKVSKEGIAVSYVLSENLDKLTITLDKAFFDQVMTLLPVLVKLIPSDSDSDSDSDSGNDMMVSLIQTISEQLPDVWAKTTKFEVSLKLEK